MKKTLGLVIPATINYINDLENLLENISYQSVKPDVISISISEVEYYYPKKDYGLNLIITCHIDKKNGASNRNIGVKNLNTDLISFFDCDDFMHQDRTKFIKSVFQNYNINALVHDYEISEPVSFKQKKFDLENFKNQKFENYTLHIDEINHINTKYLFPVDIHEKFLYHNAHVTIKKEIFEKIQYDEQHIFPDSLFNRNLVLNKIPISYLENKLSYYNL